MSQILCSTGALIGRYNNRNYRLLEELKNELSCDGFEFMIYPAWYEELDKLVPFLQDAKLNIPVMHCEKGIGELISNEDKEAFSRFEINCHVAKSIGAEKLVFHLWNGITSDKFIHRNIAACEKLMAIAEKYGRKLLIENVVCNRKDPMTHWLKLAETYPDIGFIFDTKMADFHRQLDDFYEHKELHNKVHHYHVNDFAGEYKDWQNLWVLPIGKGHIDWDKFFDHIKERGYDGTFTTESTALEQSGVINTKILNEQFDFIRNKLK